MSRFIYDDQYQISTLQSQDQVAQNCLQNIQGISGSIGEMVGGCFGYQQPFPVQHVYCCHGTLNCRGCMNRPDLGKMEFRITKHNKDDLWMDYGSKLKILMADPIRGIDLRDAVQKLKEALMKMEE